MHEGKPVTVEVVKHYPPDTTAAIYWTKNRLPKEWRDRQEVTDPTTRGRYEELMDKIHALEKAGGGLQDPALMEGDDGDELRYNGKGSSFKH